MISAKLRLRAASITTDHNDHLNSNSWSLQQQAEEWLDIWNLDGCISSFTPTPSHASYSIFTTEPHYDPWDLRISETQDTCQITHPQGFQDELYGTTFLGNKNLATGLVAAAPTPGMQIESNIFDEDTSLDVVASGPAHQNLAPSATVSSSAVPSLHNELAGVLSPCSTSSPRDTSQNGSPGSNRPVINIQRLEQKHVCTHTGCSKRFTTGPQLKRHIKSHKMYSCDMCTRTYPHPKSLREHRQTKHERKRYYCDVDGCNKSVAQKKNLARHKASEHQMNTISSTG